MADITTAKAVAVARLKTHILEMQLQLQRLDERRVVIADEIQKMSENETAARKDLTETQQQLVLLEK